MSSSYDEIPISVLRKAERAIEFMDGGNEDIVVEAVVREIFDGLGMEVVVEGRFDVLDHAPPEKKQFRSRWIQIE